MVWSRLLMDRAQHGAKQPHSCTQLGLESFSALKSSCSQHFQKLESTSTATHAGNSVGGLNSQTLLKEHLPTLTISLQTFSKVAVRKKSTFSAYPTDGGSLLGKVPDTPLNVLVALLCTTTQKKQHYFYSCKGEEMET